MNKQKSLPKLCRTGLQLFIGFALTNLTFGQTSQGSSAGTAARETLEKIKAQTPASLPRRTIIMVIDGLVAGAVERLPLVHMEKLKSEGAYYQELLLPLAAHPRLSKNEENNSLYYPWSCSIPNPIMMTGTVFIGQPGIKETMLQYSFKQAGKRTAFLVDSDAYDEIAGGYDNYTRRWDSSDDAPVFPELQKVIEQENPHFIRVHLQSTGGGGYIDQRNGRTIWDSNAEYRRRAIKADLLVSQFVDWLKEKGLWEETVLFICGDHGQTDKGGHPPYQPGGDKTSLLAAGKGIKKGAAFPYAEMTDLAPTIAYLQSVATPKYNQGRILTEALVNGPATGTDARLQEELNNIMQRHRQLLDGQPALSAHALNKDFLVIEQIGTWHKRFRDLPALVKHQREILGKLETQSKQPL
jgi:hypothetical protein